MGLVLLSVGFTYNRLAHISSGHDNSMTGATVMITNMKGNSGGTGVFVESDGDDSVILTNSHICGLIKSGGKIVTDDGKVALAQAYVRDMEHDLCLVKVHIGSKSVAKMSSRPPRRYEPSTISGHPALLPTVITQGYYSDTIVIQVLSDIEKCTKEQMNNESTALVCLFFGGMPIINTYESTVVTATIMGGSSGSAVYNSSGELSGLVFAGSGKGISYAFTVPYSYVYDFLHTGIRSYITIDYKQSLEQAFGDESKIDKNYRELINKKCLEETLPKQVEPLCAVFADII